MTEAEIPRSTEHFMKAVIEQLKLATDAARNRGWAKIHVTIHGADGSRHVITGPARPEKDTAADLVKTVLTRCTDVEQPFHLVALPRP